MTSPLLIGNRVFRFRVSPVVALGRVSLLGSGLVEVGLGPVRAAVRVREGLALRGVSYLGLGLVRLGSIVTIVYSKVVMYYSNQQAILSIFGFDTMQAPHKSLGLGPLAIELETVESP